MTGLWGQIVKVQAWKLPATECRGAVRSASASASAVPSLFGKLPVPVPIPSMDPLLVSGS